MAIDKGQLLEAAKKIMADGCDETNSRTATNRSYYAVHHLAKDIQKKYAIPPSTNPNGGSHLKLYNALIDCSSAHDAQFMTIRQIGYMAKGTLKPLREHADYKLHLDFDKSMAENAIARSECLLEKAKLII